MFWLFTAKTIGFYENEEEQGMNGFNYDELEKKIRINDQTTTVIWEDVQKDVAEKAAELYGKSENIDDFLIEHNCKRFWGNI